MPPGTSETRPPARPLIRRNLSKRAAQLHARRQSHGPPTVVRQDAERIQGGPEAIGAGDVLLARFKGRALKLCVRLGIVMSSLSAVLGAFSVDPLRRIGSAALVLACWTIADRFRRRWVPDVLADRRLVLAAGAASVIPFAIDGHAQSDAFMAVASLAGVAALACRRREVAAFAVVWVAAYVAGTIIGGGGFEAFVASEHPFDASQQITSIVACTGLFAFAMVGFRRFVVEIPATVDAVRRTAAETADDGERTGSQPNPHGLLDKDDAGAGRVAAPGGASEPRASNKSGPRSRRLTERESDVLGLLAEGRTRHDVASLLFISEHTVKDHIDNAKHKLGVRTQREAVATYAMDYDAGE
jgi:DNA-binding CsgD family transcriptional regulator